MIRVLFFARLREAISMGEVQLAAEGVVDVNSLIDALARQFGEHVSETLCKSQVVCAVNHQVVDRTHAVKIGDEVAFYPPVTGG